MVVNYLRSYSIDAFHTQSHHWSGSYDISGGHSGKATHNPVPSKPGQDGTVHSTKCFPGYAGAFCSPCPVGTYKYHYSFGKCLKCENKPTFSSYINRNETSALCGYECNPLFEKAENNPDCLDPVSLEYERIGGAIPFFVLMSIFLVVSLLMFGMLSHKSTVIQSTLKDLPETIYQVWEDEDEYGRGKTLENDFGLID